MTECTSSIHRDQCAEAGNLPRCRLCPKSPTYWPSTASPASTTPWDGKRTIDATPEPDNRPDYSNTLNWGTGAAEKPTWSKQALPCVICNKPANMRSPRKDQPIHKRCAENWTQAHPRSGSHRNGQADTL